MSLTTALILILGALALGDIVAAKTNATIPSAFVTATLFLVGYWTIFPTDILAVAGFSPKIITISILFLITHLGTMLSLKELISQWKTVTISITGILGLCGFAVLVGSKLFGVKMILASTPPLAGGVVAATLMSEAANAKGMESLGVLAILMYVMQGFAGYPLTSFALKREGKRLLNLYRSGEASLTDTSDEGESSEESKTLIPPLPEKYQTTSVLFLKLALVGTLGVYLEILTGGYVSKYVFCLILGVIASTIGFLERRPLNLSNSFGFFITGLMAFIFGGLAKATPTMIAELIVPFLTILALGLIGLALGSLFIGKFLGESYAMSFAIALNALYGFPVNYTLTTEVSKALGKDEDEVEFLTQSILPKMLVGGFTSVTIVSVVVAGVFVKLI